VVSRPAAGDHERAALVTTLKTADEIRLHIVPPLHTTPVACDGTYTCSCERCIALRLDLVERGVRRRQRQPHEPLRRAAA
jgi:hypothetical protein